MPFKFDLTKELTISETEMVFDSQFHPSKHNIIALSTIEGDVKL
jgi:hypothetical protein